MDNGAALYRRFLAGDEAALSQLLKTYREGLVLYVNGIVRNIYDAEDITQEVFILLFVKRPALKEGAAFKAWLYAVARNKAIDHLRKRKKETVCSAEESLRELSAVEDVYITSDRRQILLRQMEKLAPSYREVLFLTYFEGLSNKQTAKIMKKNVHAVEMLNSRARAALRKQLEKEGYTNEDL